MRTGCGPGGLRFDPHTEQSAPIDSASFCITRPATLRSPCSGHGLNPIKQTSKQSLFNYSIIKRQGQPNIQPFAKEKNTKFLE